MSEYAQPSAKPFLPRLCRVMAGFSDVAFAELAAQMDWEALRRGHQSESLAPALEVRSVVLAGLDNLGWLVFSGAFRKERERRLLEAKVMADKMSEIAPPELVAAIGDHAASIRPETRLT